MHLPDRGQQVLGRLGLGGCAGLNRQELVTRTRQVRLEPTPGIE